MLPNRSLNPHQSVSRINGCIKPELTTSFPLCIWPLCIISSSTKGFLYMSPCMHLTNQTPTMVLVGQGLRAAQVHYSLVCTPLAPYWNIVYLSWTRGKCWEIGNWQSWEREEKEMGGSWEASSSGLELAIQTGWRCWALRSHCQMVLGQCDCHLQVCWLETAYPLCHPIPKPLHKLLHQYWIQQTQLQLSHRCNHEATEQKWRVGPPLVPV